MIGSRKSFGKFIAAIGFIIVAVVATWFFMRSRPAGTDALPIPLPVANATLPPIASPSKTAIPQPPGWDDAKAKRLKEAKERLPWASESDLMALIASGLNVENIERGRYRVDNDVSHLVVAMRSFKKQYGSYPSGSAAQVAKALTGENKEQVIFIEWPDKQRSTIGELLDQWGTPYDIKVVNNIITVRSAGPDGLFETKDDTILAK